LLNQVLGLPLTMVPLTYALEVSLEGSICMNFAAAISWAEKCMLLYPSFKLEILDMHLTNLQIYDPNPPLKY
jgi:hypothetical protein